MIILSDQVSKKQDLRKDTAENLERTVLCNRNRIIFFIERYEVGSESVILKLFEELIAIVADYIGVPADAVRRDYYIVQMMQNLQNSEYAEVCVFKGGTSLSKCYPGSINRFSEDIDLTFIPVEDMTNKKYSKALKRVEDTISAGFLMEKIEDERNDRNKSAFVWPENESKETCRVKLEIGSSVRPDPSLRPQILSAYSPTDAFSYNFPGRQTVLLCPLLYHPQSQSASCHLLCTIIQY